MSRPDDRQDVLDELLKQIAQVEDDLRILKLARLNFLRAQLLPDPAQNAACFVETPAEEDDQC